MNLWRATKEKARQATYFFQGKTETEKLVLEATNDDPWGPANTQMAEIARISMNWGEMENVKKALWERMGETSEVRHVQKALLLLEYLLRNGNESFRNDCRMMLGQLQSLTVLHQYEVGENAALEAVIRKKSEDVIQMINDNDIYQMEREKARKLNGAVTAVSGGGMGYGNDGFSSGYGGSYGSSSNYGNDSYNGGSSYGNSSYSAGGFNDSYSSTKKTEPEPEPEEDEELDFDPRQGAAQAPAPQQQQGGFDPFGGAPAQPQGGFDPFGGPAAQPQQQGGFDPFGGAPAQKPAQPQGGFDLFGGAPAQPQQQQGGFNAFGGAPAQKPAQPQGGFDLFGGAPSQPQQKPAQPAGGFDFFGGAPAQPQQQQNMGFGQPQQNMGFGQPQQQNMGFGQPQQQQQMGFGQPMGQQQNMGFGQPQQQQMGFGQPMGQQRQQQRQPSKPVDDFGGLVDLDLKGGQHRGYGKASQPRGNGPTLGGF